MFCFFVSSVSIPLLATSIDKHIPGNKELFGENKSLARVAQNANSLFPPAHCDRRAWKLAWLSIRVMLIAYSSSWFVFSYCSMTHYSHPLKKRRGSSPRIHCMCVGSKRQASVYSFCIEVDIVELEPNGCSPLAVLGQRLLERDT